MNVIYRASVMAMTILSAALVVSGRAQAEGWRYYEPDKRMKFSTYETDARPGQLGPITVVCENFILKIAVQVPQPRSSGRPVSFRLEAGPKVAMQMGTLMKDQNGYYISNTVNFQDPIFAIIEKGGFIIRNDDGSVLGEVRSSNPYLKDLVYDCRK